MKPECCNKQMNEFQRGRVTSIKERTRYTVYFCPECGECRVTGLHKNQSFEIRISIPKRLMYEALNNAYQRAKKGTNYA